MEDYVISVIVANDQLQSKGGNTSSLISKTISSEILKASINEFVTNIEKTFDGLKSTTNSFELEEFELNIEISASGGINLIGTVQGGAKSGITMKFKRISHE